MEEEEQLHHDLRDFTDRGFLRGFLRSSLPFWLLLGLSFLLNLFLSSLALARVSGLSSQLRELKPQQELNFSNRDSLLFPCGPNSRDWEYFHGKCYYFSLGKSSWERARSQCRELGAQLVVIDSFPEQTFLMFRTRNERFWIGLSDRNSEGIWEWIDGTDYGSSFTFWKEGEPNDSGGNEDCAHLWLGGRWNDVHCNYECFFICEKKLPP